MADVIPGEIAGLTLDNANAASGEGFTALDDKVPVYLDYVSSPGDGVSVRGGGSTPPGDGSPAAGDFVSNSSWFFVSPCSMARV